MPFPLVRKSFDSNALSIITLQILKLILNIKKSVLRSKICKINLIPLCANNLTSVSERTVCG